MSEKSVHQEKALAKIDLPSAPLMRVSEFVSALERMKAQANILLPVQQIDFIPEMMAVSFRVVQLDPTPDAGDVYRNRAFCKPNEGALTKAALNQIWNNAGGQIEQSYRTDDRSDPHYCAWCVLGSITLLDGRAVRRIANKEIDLRDGSDETKKMTAKQLAEARRHIQTMAETKALNRLIRASLSLRQTYTIKELAKPFVMPTLICMPDTSDPMIRRMVAAKALGMESMLYGVPPATAEAEVAQPRQIAAPVEPAQSEQPEEAQPEEAQPWDEEEDVVGDVDGAPAFPVPAAVVERVDDERRKYLIGINTVYTKLVEAAGSNDAALAIAQEIAIGINWETEDLRVIGEVGRSIRAEASRVGGGA